MSQSTPSVEKLMVKTSKPFLSSKLPKKKKASDIFSH